MAKFAIIQACGSRTTNGTLWPGVLSQSGPALANESKRSSGIVVVSLL